MRERRSDAGQHRGDASLGWFFLGLFVLPPAVFFGLNGAGALVSDDAARVLLFGWFAVAGVAAYWVLRGRRRATWRLSASNYEPYAPAPQGDWVVEGIAACAGPAKAAPLARAFAVVRGDRVVVRGADSVTAWQVTDADGKTWRIFPPVWVRGPASTVPVDGSGRRYELPNQLRVDGELREWIVHPGDRVRVYGRADVEADPGGAAATYRQTPTIDVVRGDPQQPVIVEVVTATT